VQCKVLELSALEWDLLQDVIEILKPYAAVCQKFEGQKYPSLPLVLVSFLGLWKAQSAPAGPHDRGDERVKELERELKEQIRNRWVG
jgi:hypothetical protein